MEITLTTTITCASPAQQKFIFSLLDGGDSIDEAEVKKNQMPWYHALQDLAPPDYINKTGKQALEASWLAPDLDEHKAAVAALATAGVKDAYSVLAGDDGWYLLWVLAESKLIEYEKWNGKPVTDLFEGKEDHIPILEKIRKDHNSAKLTGAVTSKGVLVIDAPEKKKKKADKKEDVKTPVPGKYWHPEDPAWMKQRKEEWAKIKHNLDILGSSDHDYKKSYSKYHKELFFYGTVNEDINKVGYDERSLREPPKHHLGSGGSVFMGMLSVIHLWYHPEPDDVDNQVLLDSLLQRSGLPGAFGTLDMWISASRYPPRLLDPVYGLMGGRESLIADFLTPGENCKHVVELPHGQSRELYIYPVEVFWWCICALKDELRTDALFIPRSPGQYLWKYVSYSLEHHKLIEYISKKSPHLRDWVLYTLAEIFAFEKRKDVSRRRPSTVSLVERMLQQYERKECSDILLALWNEAKQNTKKLNEKSREIRYFGFSEEEMAEELSRRAIPIEFSVAEQRERMAKWELI